MTVSAISWFYPMIIELNSYLFIIHNNQDDGDYHYIYEWLIQLITMIKYELKLAQYPHKHMLESVNSPGYSSFGRTILFNTA